MTNRSFRIFFGLTLEVGVYVDYELAVIRSLEANKLVTIVGLFLSLLAVFALSEVLVSNPGWKKFCVELIAVRCYVEDSPDA